MAFAGTCLLFALAPFERLKPLLELPAQNVTTVEAAIGAALAAWGLSLLALGERPRWRTAVTWPFVAWLLVALIAALLAPAFNTNALKVTARLMGGVAVLLLAVNGATSAFRLRVLIGVALASSVLVAGAATLEYAGVAPVVEWLNAFRTGVHVVGGHVRASGTLQYPTIASMYLEIVFALGVGLFLASVDRRAAAVTALAFLGLALAAEGIIVTLTRAGLVSMAAVLAMVGGARFLRVGVDRGVAGLAVLATVVGLLFVSSASAESLRLRLTTEGQRDWYRAGFLAEPALEFRAGSLNVVEATVINKGRITWKLDAKPPFHVSYHWFDEQMTRVVHYDGLRTALPVDLAPGESARVAIDVRAPRAPGTYTLGWDVVQEGRLWFSTEPGARLALSTVTVGGEFAPAVIESPRRTLPPQAERVGRLTLWNTAVRMFSRHPVLGIGPDNFRLTYGREAGLTMADDRVTSNNTYLEVLIGTGLVGLAAFGWLLWRAQRAISHTAATLTGSASSLYAGVAAAAFVIGLHGLVDSFLTLTPTYLVMAMTLGLAMAPSTWEGKEPDADRV